MLLKREYKTLHGAQRRAAFENAHCHNRYKYFVVRCVQGVEDQQEFQEGKVYNYRLRRVSLK